MAQDMRMAFHDWPATFQAEVLDLSSSPESTARIIQDCDKKYGPISHMYALAGCPNQNRRNPHWGMDTTIDLVKINVLGVVSAVLSMYECMKSRRYGKICIVGSISERNSPSNMISHASTKSFMITFASKLRVRASTSNIDVVIVDPDFINSGIAKKIGANTAQHAGPQLMAALMKEAVEMGGVGVVNLPITHSVKVYALRALNPICEEIWNWTAMKVGLGKKMTRSG
ncbi:uncharacterized protein LACBIDRAFT_309723 [Laccaria bicolor S238N-H82]|uniref:Predicted protein n=1 Tax=Laccaria bicolor (strain S238N-H82 / ATCC MYA-4686) TaxID=486041 RepID=B0DSX7_LACBS|nr:uncharacterized protein LACBIDRAFT_309723 [Laccaria bicolor S238N-H82]EDR02393.1 predicted protein [Laccaria bicolor S238N-H82]|eukprot:XP_001887070.1 predicted protein [Laccaria bicolor S238N-H82]